MAGFPTAAIQDLAANKSAAIINIDSDKADELMKKYPLLYEVNSEGALIPGRKKIFILLPLNVLSLLPTYCFYYLYQFLKIHFPVNTHRNNQLHKTQAMAALSVTQ